MDREKYIKEVDSMGMNDELKNQIMDNAKNRRGMKRNGMIKYAAGIVCAASVALIIGVLVSGNHTAAGNNSAAGNNTADRKTVQEAESDKNDTPIILVLYKTESKDAQVILEIQNQSVQNKKFYYSDKIGLKIDGEEIVKAENVADDKAIAVKPKEITTIDATEVFKEYKEKILNSDDIEIVIYGGYEGKDRTEYSPELTLSDADIAE